MRLTMAVLAMLLACPALAEVPGVEDSSAVARPSKPSSAGGRKREAAKPKGKVKGKTKAKAKTKAEAKAAKAKAAGKPKAAAKGSKGEPLLDPGEGTLGARPKAKAKALKE